MTSSLPPLLTLARKSCTLPEPYSIRDPAFPDRALANSVDLGGNHQSTSLTWLVNIPAGTQAMFSLLDANGDEAWSGAVSKNPASPCEGHLELTLVIP